VTQRLKEQALELIAARGFRALNVDALAAATGAGKAGVYRRWATLSDLVADALTDHMLVPQHVSTGSPIDDLRVLLGALTRELTTAERAAASLLGPARHDPTLAAALDAAVVSPLRDAISVAIAADTAVAADTPRASGSGPQTKLLVTAVLALWWDRYLMDGPQLSKTELDQFIVTTLLPAVDRAPDASLDATTSDNRS
jgi:AcrR family transcriptional regulator